MKNIKAVAVAWGGLWLAFAAGYQAHGLVAHHTLGLQFVVGVFTLVSLFLAVLFGEMRSR